jgi:hypothetical protein
MNLTISLVAITALAFGCSSSKQDPPADRGSAALPLPSKLPPPGPPQPQAPSKHGSSIDDSYAQVLAMYEAPEGATTCESVLNAVVAEQAAAKSLRRPSIFSFVAAKETFLDLCRALPPASQQCLVPRYQARNQATCMAAKTPSEQLEKLYVVRKDLDNLEPSEPDQAP